MKVLQKMTKVCPFHTLMQHTHIEIHPSIHIFTLHVYTYMHTNNKVNKEYSPTIIPTYIHLHPYTHAAHVSNFGTCLLQTYGRSNGNDCFLSQNHHSTFRVSFRFISPFIPSLFSLSPSLLYFQITSFFFFFFFFFFFNFYYYLFIPSLPPLPVPLLQLRKR